MPREFVGGLPVHVPGWMLAAFFMGLSPAVLHFEFGLNGGLVAGFTAFLAPFSAAVATVAFGRKASRRTTSIGVSLVLVGMTLVLVGVTAEWLSLVWLATAVVGLAVQASLARGDREPVTAPLCDTAHRAA